MEGEECLTAGPAVAVAAAVAVVVAAVAGGGGSGAGQDSEDLAMHPTWRLLRK